MVEVRKYHLPATALMPNSPHPLLHYPSYFSAQDDLTANRVCQTFNDNGWEVQWIYRYGETQRSHYHSGVHECMAVLSGSATIRFGVADTSLDMKENTCGRDRETGGVELEAHEGDVFVLPAGTAHKTFNTKPEASFTLLTPGDGHHIAGPDIGKALKETQDRITGFTMIGAYPKGGGYWDSCKGGEHHGVYEKVWAVPKPERDPVLGSSNDGLQGLWA
ncbi:unnamed protein product [Colletotrichum noveboracense]|uniref:Cupin type-1 domain-containing protein n=1 Tax=Colletotrichum noveboracense TaxID=2664923 RepID=A0A9W4WF73_9PEZI|nr:unnamed protein product [Colletotrichum noveboracense]